MPIKGSGTDRTSTPQSEDLFQTGVNHDQRDRPFTVLALDGGGMRGLYSIQVLESLIKHFGQSDSETRGVDFGRGFDLITGTSIGGILACGLAAGRDPSELSALLREFGPKTFQSPIPKPTASKLLWILRHLTKSANTDVALRLALESVFGNATLESVYKTRNIALCIPSVDVATGKSYVFKTPHAPHFTRDRQRKLVDVCLGTSAAPIYLPLATFKDSNATSNPYFFADGGLWANNPTLVGLIEALEIAPAHRPIHVLSVTTCPSPQGQLTHESDRHWGILRWGGGTAAVSMSLEAQSWGYFFMANKLAAILCGMGRECRITRLPHSPPSASQASHVALDQASAHSIQALYDLARNDTDIEVLMQDPRIFASLKQIFAGMPKLSENRKHERRSVTNVTISVQITDASDFIPATLLDESDSGVRILLHSNRPPLSASCAYTSGSDTRSGTVRWSKTRTDGRVEIGVQRAYADERTESSAAVH